MLKGYFVLLFLGCMSSVKAQSEEEKVMKVLVQLFDGIRESDTLAIRALFLPNAIVQTVLGNEGTGEVGKKSLDELLSVIGKEIAGTFDERIMFEMVKVDGGLASVWTPYLFNYNGSLMHCGVNSIQLVNTKEGWKINYLIDTKRTDHCGPSHLYK